MLAARLSAWFAEIHRARFGTPAELKAQVGSASIISDDRVVFNIKGNDYRLVAAVDYARQSLYIKWIGTHKEYDQLDVRTVGIRSNGMTIRPIRGEDDHAAALKRIEVIWAAEQGTAQGDELDILTTLVDAYEAEHFPVVAPSAVDAIEFRMEQQGLTRRELEPLIGSRARVSEILSGKRALTLPMIRRLHVSLQIPLEVLIAKAPSKSHMKAKHKRTVNPSTPGLDRARPGTAARRSAAAPVAGPRSRAA